jgi:regulatory protein
MSKGTITGLEAQKRNKKRVSVYIDDDYAFSLALDEAVKLHKGQMLSEAEIDALRGEDDVLRAVDRAAHYLGSRPRSEAEVRRNLREKEVPPHAVDAAIERLYALGYLDDEAFARFWVQDRSSFKAASPKAIRYELKEKGIADAIIAEVLADVDVDTVALQAARSQLRRYRGSDRAEFKKKLGGYLQRRGFTYGDARTALQQLIEELETEDPEFFASADDVADDDTWAGN